MMILYNILLVFVFCLIILGIPVIIPVILFSEKRRKTVLQRMALTPFPKKIRQNRQFNKDRIWIHALSLGETVSAVPLVKAMKQRFSNKQILFSASTKTGFETAQKELAGYVESFFYFPYDFLIPVKKVMDQVNPEFVVIVETDIWPNFMCEAQKRAVPVFLVNTRLSQRSFSGYKRFSFFTAPIFQIFTMICTQSGADAERFKKLIGSSDKIITTGNLKFDQPVENIPDAGLQQIRSVLNINKNFRIIVAGSTHEGEEEIIAQVYKKLKKSFDNLCLIIAPRNPERAGDVCQIFKSGKINALKMAQIQNKQASFDVMVVDRIGVLKKLYALSDISFAGGSLKPFGGHNPLEPAAFARPVIFGPHMSDFKEISQFLLESGGAVQVKDAQSLYDAAFDLLKNPGKAENTGNQAFKVFNDNKGAVDRTVDIIEQYLIKFSP